MSLHLHLCLDCATVYLVEGEQELICPRCGGSLELREKGEGSVESLAVWASRALHGLERRVRRLWEVG